MTHSVTVREAAEELGVALSTVHKRCRLVDLPKTRRADGQTMIDLDALKARWAEHIAAADERRRKQTSQYTKWLNASVTPDMLDELDAVADARGVSRSEVTRLAITEGLTAYYTNGRKFSDG